MKIPSIRDLHCLATSARVPIRSPYRLILLVAETKLVHCHCVASLTRRGQRISGFLWRDSRAPPPTHRGPGPGSHCAAGFACAESSARRDDVAQLHRAHRDPCGRRALVGTGHQSARLQGRIAAARSTVPGVQRSEYCTGRLSQHRLELVHRYYTYDHTYRRARMRLFAIACEGCGARPCTSTRPA